MSDHVTEQIRSFLAEQLAWGRDRGQLTDDYPLITSRALDSLGLMQLVTFLEDEFDVVVEDDELLPERFENVASISSLVKGKMAG